MPSEVRVVDQKFYAKLSNGNDFLLNPSDFARHLKGGVNEHIKAVFNVQVSWFTELAEDSTGTYIDVPNDTFLLRNNGKDFGQDGEGFSIGDSIKYSAISFFVRGIITSISGGEIIVNITSTDSVNIGWFTPTKISYLTGLTDLTALEYKFGLIENDEGVNFLSKLTGTEQIFRVDDIDHGAPLTFSVGESFGNNKAWVTGGLKCAFVGLSFDNDKINTEDTTQEFQIEHIFIGNPDYRDGEIDSIKGIDPPPEDIYEGNKSLKYVLSTEFRTVLSNPNTSKISIEDTQKGSFGYYGESYNGFPNNYSVDALVYTVGGNDANQISVGEITNVAFDLLSSESTFAATTPVIVGHKSLINSLAYSNSPNDFNTQWTNEILRTETGDSPLSGTLIKNYQAIFVNSGKISIVFDVEFTAPQNRILSDGQEYVLYFNVGDPTKAVDKSDKVTDIIDSNTYDKNNDISGLFDVVTLDQYPLPEPFEKGVTTGFTEGNLFIEDEQMCYSRFKILNTYLGDSGNLLEDVRLNSLKFKIVAYNTEDNTWFNLRSLNIDLSNDTATGNIQNIELDSTRGYTLTDTDIFNSLVLSTDNNDGTWQFYDLKVGYKIPWQTWLALLDAAAVFYDKTKSQNNQNQSAETYSNKGLGANVFVDGDNGTFESGITGLTLLPYSGGTPNQIGGGMSQSNTYSNSGGFCLQAISGSPSMSEAVKRYSILKNDTGMSVEIGKRYELSYYIAVDDTLQSGHLDNGNLFMVVDGYADSSMEFSTFRITANNLTANGSPTANWIKCRTIFVAEATANITTSLVEEIQVNITVNNGFTAFVDDISLKTINYDIRILIDADVETTDITTNYVKRTGSFNAYGYNEDDNIINAFSCEINTYNDSGIALENNIIEKKSTEVRAVFTPTVPITPSSSIDFTEVSTLWNRYAHGNKYVPVSGAFRIPNWLNDQADDVDTFADNTSTFTKNDPGLYTSTASSIETNFNAFAVYGCFSLIEYEFYSIAGAMFSGAPDNDTLIYDICFFTDDLGIEHTLSLCATTGGIFSGLAPTWVDGDDSTSTIWFENVAANWSLVYNFGKRDAINITQFDTTKAGFNWNSGSVGDFMFDVSRSADSIIIDGDWTIDGVQFTNQILYNLNDNAITEKFKGFNKIGFGFMSQDQGGFKDVVLSNPSEEYYGVIRMETDDSPSDFGMNESNTEVENTSNSLLKQISGTENKARLSYDGTDFIVQSLVATDKVIDGQDYKFSAELRLKDLEA